MLTKCNCFQQIQVLGLSLSVSFSDPRGFKVEHIRKLDEEERLEYGDSDDDDFRVGLPLKRNKPKKVRNYKSKMENWENAEVRSACTIFTARI